MRRRQLQGDGLQTTGALLDCGTTTVVLAGAGGSLLLSEMQPDAKNEHSRATTQVRCICFPLLVGAAVRPYPRQACSGWFGQSAYWTRVRGLGFRIQRATQRRWWVGAGL